MKKLFCLLMIIQVLGCQTPAKEKVIQLPVDTSLISKRKNDSIKEKNMFDFYDNIINAKYWKSLNKRGCYIDIIIATNPMVYVEYRVGKDREVTEFMDWKDYGDSLSITTVNIASDTVMIWTLKNQDTVSGLWSVYKPQVNSYKALGIFKHLKKYE